jgi:TolA-binding protein
MIRRLCPLLLMFMVAALPLTPASKEILDLQRDVAQLQEQIRLLTQAQSAQTQQLTSLGVLIQQSLEASKSADRSIAVLQSGIQQSLNDQKKEVVAPVVGLSTRMDQVSNDVRTLQQAVADLTSSMSKMQAQLTDINNGIKVLQTPPVAPPPVTVPGANGQPGGAPQAQAMPPMPAMDLYQAALNDRSAGKLDLALQEFTEYLKWYGNTELAGNAQYYIGWIHYSQGANDPAMYDVAAKDFDTLLEKYPDNQKVNSAEANLYKGLSLKKAGKRTQSRAEFNQAIAMAPRSENATKACAELKDMGFTCPSAAPVSKGTTKKKKS